MSNSTNLRTLVKLASFSVFMFGFGYALVPLFPVVCKTLGINYIGVESDPVNTQVDRTRTVGIEFDSNVHNMPWAFKPLLASMTVHPGEIVQVMYEVVNNRNEPVTGQAIPSYGPSSASEYFHKMDCFCFTKQTLAPGERRQMPVVFVVDPKLPREIPNITLSYTFFEVEGNRRAESQPVKGGV